MMLRRVCIAFVLLILYEQNICQATPITSANVRSAKVNEFPFIVSLSRKESVIIASKESNHFCGGTLITKKHVLTAGHCFDKINSTEEFVVKVKSIDLRNAEIHEVKAWINYTQWAKEKVGNEDIHDIAIVELKRCVTRNMKPAIITNIPDDQLYGKTVVTAGWGSIAKVPRYLQTGALKVTNPEKCVRFWKDSAQVKKTNVTPLFLCTQADPPVILECGDSGSPLLTTNNEIIGINQSVCHRKDDVFAILTINIHMSINYYKQFIYDVARYGRSPCCIH